MSEYIDRENYCKNICDRRNDNCDRMSGCTIWDAPKADVAPVRHGRWENGKCTGCGFEPSWLLEDGESFLAQWVWDEGLDFCPGCGARMDGEDEE